MIVASVALPMYKSSRIAWLALESLCNQKNAPDWELLVCEEREEAFGEERLFSYRERLEKAGCKHIEYIVLDKWTPLPQKWALMGRKAAKTSGVFLLQGSDDYSDENRIAKSYEKVVNEGYDWYEHKQGVFYSINTGSTILYTGRQFTNMSMSFKTEYARTIPHSNQPNLVDGFLLRHVDAQATKLNKYIEQDLCLGAVYTQGGHQNLSVNRSDFFLAPKKPYAATEIGLSDLQIPLDIRVRLTKMTEEKTLARQIHEDCLKLIGSSDNKTAFQKGRVAGITEAAAIIEKYC